MANVLDEYLIKLGFQTDESSYHKFQNLLTSTQSTVERYSSGITKEFVKASAGVVGAYTSISAAVLGLVNKVAMADQGYQIMATKMMMTKDVARAVSIATDALGVSIADAFWNPEIRERFLTLVAEEQKMGTDLGPNFDLRMRRLRDIRFEFTQLGVAAKFLSFSFVSSLASKLPLDSIQEKVHGWLSWLIDNTPQLADRLSSALVPVLNTTWDLFGHIGDASTNAVSAFEKFIGAVTDDDALKTGTVDIEHMADALNHVVAGADKAVTNIGLLISAMGDLAAGKMKEAGKAFWDILGIDPRSGFLGATGYEMMKALGLNLPQNQNPLDSYSGAPLKGLRHGDQTAGTLFDEHGNFKGASSSDTMSRFMDAIELHEGFHPGTMAWRNNNPGNLKFAGQPGAVRGPAASDGGYYAIFPDVVSGKAALQHQLDLYAESGLNVFQTMSKYAPASSNDLPAYMAALGKAGFDPNTSLQSLGFGNQDKYVPSVARMGGDTDKSLTIRDINVYTSGDADARTIGKEIENAIERYHQRQIQIDLAQLAAAY